jgi:glucose-6-phosphate-specific signal transduction histidine kinase
MKGSTATQRIAHLCQWSRWGQHFAIAAAYAACYELTLHFSFPQWLQTAGLRLACLLLLPTRYWPALVLGEGLPLLENAIFCEPEFGAPWAFMQAVPMVVLWMALLKPIRRRWSIHDTNGDPRMGLILSAALGASIITALSTTVRLMLALQHAPGKWPEIAPADYFFAYLLGAYLGALTLTPMLLALHERFRALRDEPLTFAIIWRSPLFRDTVWWVLPALAGLAWLAMATQNDGFRLVARLALPWPVLGLAWRHGWHGTAAGGMATSIALALTAQGLLDPATIRIQAFLALSLSIALWAGARASRASQSLTAPGSQER